MSKPLKSKKDKVPKITEEQYAEYLSALKAAEESEPRRVDKTLIPPVVDYKNNERS
ncbi:MAG: hypothetical protein IJX96_02510 [Clostridia bacterium]|nr:hypothetical protein [Clostridia bacterium]